MTARPMTEGERAPCPFCGSDSIECHPNNIAFAGCNMAGASNADLHYTHCNGCGAEGPGAHSYTEAIELHNRRAPSAAVRWMREALKEARRYLDAVVANSGSSKRRENYAGAVRRIDAALSLIEGEDEQATRGEDAATAPTDRLQSEESSS